MFHNIFTKITVITRCSYLSKINWSVLQSVGIKVGLWWFDMPEVTLHCSPYAYMDPISTNLTYMFVTVFQDALTEYSYAAELAGLTYSLHNTIYGVTVSTYFLHFLNLNFAYRILSYDKGIRLYKSTVCVLFNVSDFI